jgi:dynein light chain LC8-type
MPEERRIVVKKSNLSPEMQQTAVDMANEALDRFSTEKDIASFIKKEFDKKYNPTWHCLVGQVFCQMHFHEIEYFILFYTGRIQIQLLKCRSNST